MEPTLKWIFAFLALSCCVVINAQSDNDRIPSPGRPPKETCGVRNFDGIDPPDDDLKKNEAKFGEFPWMVAILRPQKYGSSTFYLYQCGGSLIHPKVVLTAARCIQNLKGDQKFKIRAGEYDTQSQSESLPHQDSLVSGMAIHEDFNADTSINDIALLFLEKPVNLTRNVGLVCLPPQSSTIKPANCVMSGWGKDEYGRNGRYQSILKKIEIPIVGKAKCENELKKTRLGRIFSLDSSFMCAGGTGDVAPCSGDEGSPLSCPMANRIDRYVQMGVVSWTVECDPKSPGVYANVPYIRNWIDEKLAIESINDMDRYGP